MFYVNHVGCQTQAAGPMIVQDLQEITCWPLEEDGTHSAGRMIAQTRPDLRGTSNADSYPYDSAANLAVT